MMLNSPRARLLLYHALLLGGVFLFWYAMTEPGLIPPFWFDDPTRAKFFFGQPLEVFRRIWTWFTGGSIYVHLWVTLVETLLAFAIGTLLGLVFGLWLALAPTASTLADPYIKAMNAMPRVIL
ncbi:MAG: ABC transporter permease, partial [Betaproteobacteria bacterium]